MEHTHVARGKVRLSVDVPLPSLVRELLLERAGKLLVRHSHRFGSAALHLHVKPSGSQIGCIANLFTDGGSYHASIEDWNVLRGVDDIFERLHQQILKKFEKIAVRV